MPHSLIVETKRLPISVTRHYGPVPESARDGVRGSVLGSSQNLSKNESVFMEGERATYFHHFVIGAIRTSKLLRDGRRQIDSFHFPGDIFGVEAGEAHRCSAEAVIDATVIGHRSRSLTGINSNDVLGQQVVASMMRSLERSQDHILLLGRKSALEKLSEFLIGLVGRSSHDRIIELPMSRTDIADHLGMTTETVSRSLTQLTQMGMIDLSTNRHSVILLDAGALRNLGS